MLQVAGSSPDDDTDFFPNIPQPSSHTRPWVYSVSNRNKYQNIFLGIMHSRSVRLTRDDCLDNVGSSTSHNPIGLHGLLRG
jgi:hypothetical protein